MADFNMEALYTILDNLYLAVQDYIIEDPTFPSVPQYLTLPDGLDLDLTIDFRLPHINFLKLMIFNIPLVFDFITLKWNIDVYLLPFLKWFGIEIPKIALTPLPVKNSENWRYSRKGYSHQLGTSYDPVERFDILLDGGLDLVSIAILTAILWGLTQIGHQRIGEFMVKRTFKTDMSTAKTMYQLIMKTNEVKDQTQNIEDNLETTTMSAGALLEYAKTVLDSIAATTSAIEALTESIPDNHSDTTDTLNQINTRLAQVLAQIGTRLMLR